MVQNDLLIKWNDNFTRWSSEIENVDHVKWFQNVLVKWYWNCCSSDIPTCWSSDTSRCWSSENFPLWSPETSLLFSNLVDSTRLEHNWPFGLEADGDWTEAILESTRLENSNNVQQSKTDSKQQQQTVICFSPLGKKKITFSRNLPKSVFGLFFSLFAALRSYQRYDNKSK